MRHKCGWHRVIAVTPKAAMKGAVCSAVGGARDVPLRRSVGAHRLPPRAGPRHSAHGRGSVWSALRNRRSCGLSRIWAQEGYCERTPGHSAQSLRGPEPWVLKHRPLRRIETRIVRSCWDARYAAAGRRLRAQGRRKRPALRPRIWPRSWSRLSHPHQVYPPSPHSPKPIDTLDECNGSLRIAMATGSSQSPGLPSHFLRMPGSRSRSSDSEPPKNHLGAL